MLVTVYLLLYEDVVLSVIRNLIALSGLHSPRPISVRNPCNYSVNGGLLD